MEKLEDLSKIPNALGILPVFGPEEKVYGVWPYRCHSQERYGSPRPPAVQHCCHAKAAQRQGKGVWQQPAGVERQVKLNSREHHERGACGSPQLPLYCTA